MTVFFLRRGAPGEGESCTLRVGLTVGKVLGNAVERNRIKRRMREAVRASWPLESGAIDVVFNPRKSVSQLSFGALRAEVERGLRVAMQRAREAKAQES